MVKEAKAGWGTFSRSVFFGAHIFALSYWDNVIVIGLGKDIVTLDAITGSRMAVMSEHTGEVGCVTFSSDGGSLASGANDSTVKLWDIQTGGVVRTFLGHTGFVRSVSISTDYTVIVSGSSDGKIFLWDIQTGEYLYIIEQQDSVNHVAFSPIDLQYIISISGKKVWEWDLSGQHVPPTYDGTHIAFSPDCKKFAVCNEGIVTVQNPISRAIETQFHTTRNARSFCFSPDGRLIAAAADSTVYVWDIANPDSHLVGTLVGHNEGIRSIVFSSPSSLISASLDDSVKFWRVGAVSADLVMANPGSTPIVSVSLQAGAGIALSSDKEGVVKIWDISTGLCKSSFQTLALGEVFRDVRLIDDRLIVVWWSDDQIYICDANKHDPPKLLAMLSSWPMGLRISGDGSKVFCLSDESLQALSTHTGELVGEVELDLGEEFHLDPLQMDGSKIWIRKEDFPAQGWDFGISNSPPVPLSHGPTERPLLDFFGGAWWQTDDPSWIKNIVTGKDVFQLSGRYAKPVDIEWDGQCLVAGYESGEVSILDFHHLYPQ